MTIGRVPGKAPAAFDGHQATVSSHLTIGGRLDVIGAEPDGRKATVASNRLDTALGAAHARGVGELVGFDAPRSRWFEDARGRSLRASWHPEAGIVVISLWESDRCIGTFRLPVADAPELMVLLAGAVKAWAADQAAVSEAMGTPEDLAQA